MVVKYEKLLAVTSAVNRPDTILVKCIAAKEFQGVSVESLEGRYDSIEDFYKEVEHFFDVLKKGLDAAKPYMNPHPKEGGAKLYHSLLLSTQDARQLADSLIAALGASGES